MDYTPWSEDVEKYVDLDRWLKGTNLPQTTSYNIDSKVATCEWNGYQEGGEMLNKIDYFVQIKRNTLKKQWKRYKIATKKTAGW